ncbi:hypothetical protein BT63DRAFT_419533 [Microthyrium microscopicum]|uniref:Peroxin 26 n=1 Tax=Microthyrium microscopicum TaxID=703497 RepID=A0A6A6UR38_9PEZI|nr:hypothetical protein BT63DRAFT_419533 [Microthyrium microscopicum]
MTTNGDSNMASQQPAMPTITQTEDHPLSTSLHDSIHSLSSSRHQSSQVAKTYRQAANLFLTRRFPEALSTIEPIITVQPSDSGPSQNGNGADHIAQQAAVAPVAYASKTTRIKIWSFWLTFLHQVVDLGPEEGKHAFGTTKWKALVSKARDGAVWDDVVRDGYGGVEGSVDADVVVSLATLLLTHMQSQRINQEKLEAYLSAVARPSFDITSHLSSPPRLRRTSSTPGTNTPRDLQTSLKILELYTLHVLPRNGEWEYAKEFIMMSELLDDEKKEAFLHALHGLKEEREETAKREKQIQRAQQEQLERQRHEEEDEAKAHAKRAEEESRKREELRKRQLEAQPKDTYQQPRSSHNRTISGGTASKPRPAKKDISRRPSPQTLYARIGLILSNLQSLILNTTQSLSSNPMALLRTLLFILAFALMFGRREMRERIKRAFDRGWAKVSATVGMGMKVSSI